MKMIQMEAPKGTTISDVIHAAKETAERQGLPVKIDLNGIPLTIYHDTSEVSAYWQYMRSLDESVT